MKRILIIEDDVLVAKIYRQKFLMEGFSVDVAEDGEAGLRRIESEPPDVVLLDIMLPKLNGIQVLKRVRARPETKKLPVIVLSNTYLTSVVKDVWAAGASEVLAKLSKTPNAVLEVVRKLLAAAESAPAKAGGAPPSKAGAEATYQAELLALFRDASPTTLQAMRRSLRSAARSPEAARHAHLLDLYHRSHSLAASAAVVGMHFVSYTASALEALLRELSEKTGHAGESTFRTIAQTLDLLLRLMKREDGSLPGDDSQVSILVVDDDPVALRAVDYALQRAQLKSVLMDDPLQAFHLLELNQFDLVVLDFEMPGLNGAELCARLRTLPKHQKTPVVFLTASSTLERRAQSILSGGSDFVGKPFLIMELTLKVLTLILCSRLDAAQTGAGEPAAGPTASS